jgi:hypothetical protein
MGRKCQFVQRWKGMGASPMHESSLVLLDAAPLRDRCSAVEAEDLLDVGNGYTVRVAHTEKT